MAPSNLETWVTRRYDRHGLLRDSDEQQRTINNEGIASSDDHLIEVHTEWLDHDGTPLPVGLADYGYTARLTQQIDMQVFEL